ncbi:hypothetical protein ACP70R_007645 [Stipagrostis hirtigluma subsp. patula]
MGKCLRSCTKQRASPSPSPSASPPALVAAEYLTLRSGRRVPVVLPDCRCSPRSRRRGCRDGSGAGPPSGCRRDKNATADAQRSPPRCKGAAAGRQRCRKLGVGRPAELPPPSQASLVTSDVADGFGDRRDTPLSGEVWKHEHEINAVAGPRRPPPPIEAELEAFFAAAELAERRRFAETYNYVIALDRPLDGRFEWAPVVST